MPAGSVIRQTSRGCAPASRRNTRVVPVASIAGSPFTSGPWVSGETAPSRVARKTCCEVLWTAGKTTARLSGVQIRSDPARPPTRSSSRAVKLRGVPPAAATRPTYVLVYHSRSFPSWVTKAIHFPSGDQAGEASRPGRTTSGSGPPPAAGTRKRSESKLSLARGVGWRATASRRPSGENEKPVACFSLVSCRARRVARSRIHRRLQGYISAGVHQSSLSFSRFLRSSVFASRAR